MFRIVSLVVCVVLLGTFEALYNHVIKNALYFGGLSTPHLHWLFPPPTYEMPNDAFFEFTGVLQIVPGVLSAVYLARDIVEARVTREVRS